MDYGYKASEWRKIWDDPKNADRMEVTVQPGDTIIVPNFQLDLLGHSYFAQAAAILHDMYELIMHNTPPVRRQRLDPDSDFWRIRL